MSDIQSWLQSVKNKSNFFVEQIPFKDLDEWKFEENTGNLVHNSGKFFRIEGLKVQTTFGSWEQPIINQPEIGILGIITRRIDGKEQFLMQAKIEPGNINIVQIAPTVQATWSNYTQVHKGKKPSFLNYFFDNKKEIDRLESEQGARFFKKRNRNILVNINENINFPDKYRWMTLYEIKELMKIDNLINMEARSVLSCLEYSTDKRSLYNKNEIISWFSELKSKYICKVELIPLETVKDWEYSDSEISHKSKDFFSVIAVKVGIMDREVKYWTQPLIKQNSVGTIGFLTKKFDGISHFLVQGRMEPGYFDIIEMGPTISTSRIERQKLPFSEFFQNVPKEKLKFSTIFSEEGGRFYHTRNRYMIVELNENEKLDIPENYIWMTLSQLKDFLPYFGYLNIEVRTLITCLYCLG